MKRTPKDRPETMKRTPQEGPETMLRTLIERLEKARKKDRSKNR